METAIKIGHDEKTVRDVSDLIRDILTAPTGDTVKIAALKTMQRTLNITNTSVSNCHIIGSQDTTHNHYPNDETEEDDAAQDTTHTYYSDDEIADWLAQNRTTIIRNDETDEGN